jgi:hypothetical protein
LRDLELELIKNGYSEEKLWVEKAIEQLSKKMVVI